MIPSLIAAVLSSLAVTVTNPLPESRQDVPVVISIPSSAGEVRSITVPEMPDVPYQLDDMNADGIPDELVLLLDMKPSETRRFK
ncbi:DUF4861 family protein, partial [uncultured Duncaniella sp.]